MVSAFPSGQMVTPPRAYWKELQAGIDDAFKAGYKEIPDSSAPFEEMKVELRENEPGKIPMQNM